MTTGYINQKIEIYSSAIVRNEFGGADPGNVLYWSTTATVKILRSKRTQEANQSPMKMVISCRCRYRKDKEVQNNMLLKWRGSWFVIQGYVPDVVYQDYVSFDAVADNSGQLVVGNGG